MLRQFFSELRRRHVFRVAGLYAVVGWLIVQVAAALETALNLPAWFDSIVVSLLLLGFPVSLVIAWAFEVTPDGVKLTVSEKDGQEGQSNPSRRSLDYVIVAGLAVVTIGIIFQIASPRAPKDEAIELVVSDSPEEMVASALSLPFDNTVAILPFANRSINAEDAFFADGIHDDLLTRLSKIASVNVISRTSVMRYRDNPKPVPDIAEELNASMLLEGAVQRSGDRVRITVQLIDGNTDTHLWAENYDRELTTENLFDIQTDITSAIADNLNILMGFDEIVPVDKPATSSLDAYESFTKGRSSAYIGTFTENDLLTAISEFEKAIEADPKYAAAYAEKAYAHLQYAERYGDEEWHFRNASHDVGKAEALDPKAVSTLTAKAYYDFLVLLDHEAALNTFEEALLKAPNDATVLLGKAAVLLRAGNIPDTINTFEAVLKIDPVSVEAAQQLGYIYTATGEFDKAQSHLDRAMMFQPNDLDIIVDQADLWLAQGEPELAWNAINAETTEEFTDYYARRLFIATYTRDDAKVEQALNDWPVHLRSEEGDEDLYDIAYAMALLYFNRDEEAQSLLQEIKSRQDVDPIRNSTGFFYPLELAGLRKDLQGVERGMRLFENEETDNVDPLQLSKDYLVIAEAYVLAGDPDTAFQHISWITERFGPAIFARLSILPSFDSVREHSAYLALQSDYENWLSNRDE